MREEIEAYIKNKRLRKTLERKLLTDWVTEMSVFNTEELLKKAKQQRIARPTVYNFIQLLHKAGILIKNEPYTFNPKI